MPPVPEPRPSLTFGLPQNLLVAKPEEDPEADTGTPLLPRSRPGNGEASENTDDAPVIAPDLIIAVKRTAQETEACRWRIRGLGVSFDKWPTIDRGGKCRIELPLLVSELSPQISVSPAAIMGCELSEAVATWMRDVVAPAASRHLSAELTGLEQASAFHCRAGGPDALVDTHASGTALDIVGFTFKERDRLAVRDRRPENGPEGAFQREILAGACKLFTTVLSPGADFGTTEADSAHFHFDIAKRRDGRRICR